MVIASRLILFLQRMDDSLFAIPGVLKEQWAQRVIEVNQCLPVSVF
jgi:hypothetical protein